LLSETPEREPSNPSQYDKAGRIVINYLTPLSTPPPAALLAAFMSDLESAPEAIQAGPIDGRYMTNRASALAQDPSQ
jgi:hypothetical protein